MPLPVLATWLIKQIAQEGAQRAKLKLKAYILGEPLERALVQPTSVALRTAIRGQLGDHATPENEQRAVGVLTMIWTDQLVVIGTADTLLGQVRALVARAIDVANAPVFDLPEEFQPTSSLTALSDELGVVFDGDSLARSFVDAWVLAVRDGSLTDPTLVPLANYLAHEQTQELIRQLSSEERVGQLIRRAVQSAINDRDSSWIGPERWFQIHIVPIDEAMHEIYRDYTAGFTEAASALRSGDDIDRAISTLNDIRRRQDSSRVSVIVKAKVIAEANKETPFAATAQEHMIDLLTAVRGFIFGASETLHESWYSHYIERFEWLREHGKDPMVRGNYDSIAGNHDLRQPVAVVLQDVADKRIPAKWAKYVESFTHLKLLCLPASLRYR